MCFKKKYYLIHLHYPIRYKLRCLNTTIVCTVAGSRSRSRNFSIPAPAKNFGSLRLRLLAAPAPSPQHS
jgi:hypothetical protein